jgi:hypothetical protein
VRKSHTKNLTSLLILNSNQDIGVVGFLVFLTVCAYLIFIVDTNLTVDSPVLKELKSLEFLSYLLWFMR